MENLKKVVVDTNILVEYLRASNISKKEQTILFHLFLKGYKVYTTAINVIEIYAGAKEEKEKLEIKKLLNFLKILPLENTILRKIGELSFKLRKENKNVGMADLIIGVICFENELPIITKNLKHFENIKDLNIINLEEI